MPFSSLTFVWSSKIVKGINIRFKSSNNIYCHKRLLFICMYFNCHHGNYRYQQCWRRGLQEAVWYESLTFFSEENCMHFVQEKRRRKKNKVNKNDDKKRTQHRQQNQGKKVKKGNSKNTVLVTISLGMVIIAQTIYLIWLSFPGISVFSFRFTIRLHVSDRFMFSVIFSIV